ncbi:MAG: aldehyde dehydrogenase family protein [Candidatus Eremiobacterota bacterium]
MTCCEQGRIYVDGKWVAPAEGKVFPTLDPATEETLAEAAAATAADVDAAVDAAVRAQARWGRTTGAERAGFLRSIAGLIRSREGELARVEVRDNGKPLPEAAWDVGDAAGCFEFYAGLAEELDGRQGEPIALPDDRFRSRVYHEPVGPSGLIIPWNYPLLMAAWKVAPALAAGCAAVLKPSELTPLTALELAGIAAEAGLPPGVLNVVTGLGPEAGAPIASHPQLRKVAFTGSVPTGRGVMMAGAQAIKSVSLELGGKSPFLVFEDADLEAAVEWVMFGIFWNQGQVCSATSRLYAHAGIADRLLERLTAEAARIPVGNGLEPGVKLGPLVSLKQRERVEGYVEQARRDGALVTGGGRPEHLPRGYFYRPALLRNVPETSAAWREEIFGPVLAVTTFTDEDDAVARANDSPFGLAAAVMSADPERCQRVARNLEAGIVWINCSQPTFTEAPWGGMKESGIGRELGRWGLQNYLEVKQVTEYTSDRPWGWYLAPPQDSTPR